MLLTPGQKVAIMSVKCGKKCSGLVKEKHVDGVIIALDYSDFPFELGEKIEVEVPQKENALYVFKAVIGNITLGKQLFCNLYNLSKIRCIQRRSAERINVNITAEHLVLKGKEMEKNFNKGLILNLSKTGILLAVKEPIEVGSEIFISFDMPLGQNKKMPVGVVGKAVREHGEHIVNVPKEMKYCYGLRFSKSPALGKQMFNI